MKKTTLFAVAVGAAIASLAAAEIAFAQVNIRLPGLGVSVGEPEPYHFSRSPCVDCWRGTHNGRDGYHRGGGRPWERQRAQWNDRERGRRHWHEGHWVPQVRHGGRQFGGRWEEGYWHSGREHRKGYGH